MSRSLYDDSIIFVATSDSTARRLERRRFRDDRHVTALCILLQLTLPVRLNMSEQITVRVRNSRDYRPKPRWSRSANKSVCSASLSATGGKPPANAVYQKDATSAHFTFFSWVIFSPVSMPKNSKALFFVVFFRKRTPASTTTSTGTTRTIRELARVSA
jgi:hypothetical protein